MAMDIHCKYYIFHFSFQQIFKLIKFNVNVEVRKLSLFAYRIVNYDSAIEREKNVPPRCVLTFFFFLLYVFGEQPF